MAIIAEELITGRPFDCKVPELLKLPFKIKEPVNSCTSLPSSPNFVEPLLNKTVSFITEELTINCSAVIFPVTITDPVTDNGWCT